MTQKSLDYEKLQAHIVNWIHTRPDIRLGFVVGSRARLDHPADQWADLDVMLFTTNPKLYMTEPPTWLSRIANVWARTRHQTVGDFPEWLVTFEGGLDADFVFSSYPRARWKAMLFLNEYFPRLKGFIPPAVAHGLQGGAGVLGRGVRVLIDKDNLASRLQRFMQDFRPRYRQPTEAEFTEVVQRFWCLAEKTAKKVGRGELYVAVSWCYYLQESAVLPMLEWHAHATHAEDHDTWHAGRFLEEWADPRALSALTETFPHYGDQDARDALLAAMDLFHWLALETAKRLHYRYPSPIDEQVRAHLQELLHP